ncbi:MAG: hypothetical protein ABF908_00140 [Lentilactobacillus diolivorans]
MKNTQFRDLSLIPLSNDDLLVIACDCSAGIGEKQADMVAVNTAIMAAYSLRVPLMELISFGAQPIAVVDTIGNEMVPTGQRAIKGIKSELAKASLSGLPLNGSTEDNMVTKTTSVGVTVIGRIAKKNLPSINSDDLTIFQLGIPYVGETVKQHLNDIFSYDIVRQIKRDPAVIDMLPVGSKGIQYEADQMAATHGLALKKPTQWDDVKMKQSAGPATVLLAGVETSQADNFQKRFQGLKPIALLVKEDEK